MGVGGEVGWRRSFWLRSVVGMASGAWIGTGSLGSGLL